jgi:hypothetical protein
VVVLASTKGTGCSVWPFMSARERASVGVILACARDGRRNNHNHNHHVNVCARNEGKARVVVLERGCGRASGRARVNEEGVWRLASAKGDEV